MSVNALRRGPRHKRFLSKYFVYNNPLTVTFWMNFKKKKKNEKKKNQTSCLRPRQLASVFKFIAGCKKNQANFNPDLKVDMLHNEKNSGINQKFFSQNE